MNVVRAKAFSARVSARVVVVVLGVATATATVTAPAHAAGGGSQKAKADKVKADTADAPRSPPVEVQSEPPPAGRTEGAGALDEPRKVAEAYLNALAGKGREDAKSFLLGGVTLTAQDFSIPNWRIAAREEARVEERSVASAVMAMWELDKLGAESLNQVVVGEGESLALDQQQAARILGPTRAAAARFQQAYPLFAWVARVDKDLFWHPENPWRKEVRNLGKEGSYRLELHRFSIEERENDKVTRTWPLRVLRVRVKGYDSGWKILPASDWDPNY